MTLCCMLFHVTHVSICTTHRVMVILIFSENMICVCYVKAYLCINVYVYL